MTSLDDWRLARSVLPRRTVVRIAGLAVIGTVVSACGGKSGTGGSSGGVGGGSPLAQSLGKFAAGTWIVSAPDAHFATATLRIQESGTWSGTFAPDPAAGEPEDWSGTWTLTGTALATTIVEPGGDPQQGAASSVPATVTENTTARFDWTLDNKRTAQTEVVYDAKARKITLTRHDGHRTQVITATRA
ncbi:hypothetical protein [Catenulispora subtropica]|uniref:Lipocalin-like domain-containing protein n=1 Tax=Catenulispora subtropica TaxID=450798 RepID=A0ABP5CL42_9ACTN